VTACSSVKVVLCKLCHVIKKCQLILFESFCFSILRIIKVHIHVYFNPFRAQELEPPFLHSKFGPEKVDPKKMTGDPLIDFLG